ncbi:MAG: 1-deoxy-D-xylulose-5-phosphate reductoisomerase [Bacillota bacterium]|nr:1-deoxy-D-xylulose-5-phosphate reductoisomerase [Bacillota bacterium]
MKKICILGATGSIGTQALDVIRRTPNLCLHSFSYHGNASLAKAIEEEFHPKRTVCTAIEDASSLESLVEDDEVDIVLHSITGTAGIRAAVTALRAGKKVALANKETLVAAGSLVMKENTEHLIPVDSEHSAIYQCLHGSLKADDIESVVLTASGGPFRFLSYDEIRSKKASEALKHPNWNMGRKISIDSATMMNKGLEIIEAMHLFDLRLSQIEVLIHPESIIHSMVRFLDGSLLAELSKPDMRQPIHFALTGRKNLELNRLDFAALGKMSFFKPDLQVFPCLRLAMEAAEAGGILPAVLNAANEVAVEAYLQDRISFYEIASVIEDVMDATVNEPLTDLKQLEDSILLSKQTAADSVSRIMSS